MTWTLHRGDCLESLKAVASDSVDLICTDPPYGYSFMGKDWDRAVPSVDVWRECLRVLKPGGFAFVMSAPRLDVQGEMARRIAEAGFRTDFTPIYWTYKSGFPKAANVGKLVDKRLGAERERVPFPRPGMASNAWREAEDEGRDDRLTDLPSDTPATPQAKALDGSYAGYQPKPAVEVVMVAMKPLSQGTFVDQALDNRKGITWLDDARVPCDSDTRRNSRGGDNGMQGSDTFKIRERFADEMVDHGARFPANLLVSDEALGDDSRYFDLDAWDGAQELPSKVRDALPFMVVPKPSKAEKDEGCEGFEEREGGVKNDSGRGYSERDPHAKIMVRNHHPTVKPLTLMRYLITLATRPGDIVCDPYAGSGTTGVAAQILSRDAVLCELSDEYADIIEARMNAVQPSLF